MKLLALAVVLQLASLEAFSQQQVKIDDNYKDTSHCEKNWQYHWYISKDESGKFHNKLGGKIKKKDTAHLFFSAHLRNDIVEDKEINFCHAEARDKKLFLYFYGENIDPKLSVEINNDSFKSYINYRTQQCGHLGSFEVGIDTQELTLNKPHAQIGDTVSGYLSLEYHRIYHSNVSNTAQETKYHVRGGFTTKVE